MWNRCAIRQRGGRDAFEFRKVELGGNDMVVTGVPLLRPQSLVEWLGAAAPLVGLRGEGPASLYEAFNRVVLHGHRQVRANPGTWHLQTRIQRLRSKRNQAIDTAFINGAEIVGSCATRVGGEGFLKQSPVDRIEPPREVIAIFHRCEDEFFLRRLLAPLTFRRFGVRLDCPRVCNFGEFARVHLLRVINEEGFSLARVGQSFAMLVRLRAPPRDDLRMIGTDGTLGECLSSGGQIILKRLGELYRSTCGSPSRPRLTRDP